MKRIVMGLALVVGLWGCGGGAGDAGELTDRSAYPSGPYGKTAGSILENLEFVNSDGTPYSFNDVFADPANRVLLVTTTADWCSACKEEQKSLVELHRQYGERGLAIVVAMFENGEFDPAEVENARVWKERYELPVPVVLDANPFQLGAYYDRRVTPMNMVVDVDTMEIIDISTGFNEQKAKALIEAHLP